MSQYATITDLSVRAKEIFALVKNGETIIILRHHKPIAAIVPLDKSGEDLTRWSFKLKKESNGGGK